MRKWSIKILKAMLSKVDLIELFVCQHIILKGEHAAGHVHCISDNNMAVFTSSFSRII